MKIKISPKKFVATMNAFISSKRTMCNFNISNGSLQIQILNDYTATCAIPCEIVDRSVDVTNVSLWLTNSINILDNEHDIFITLLEDLVIIEQDTFTGTYTREFEDMRRLPDVTSVELLDINAQRLKHLVHMAVSCNTLSKELSIVDPDMVIVNNVLYLNYVQTMILAVMKLPRICIPLNTLRETVFKFDEHAKYHYFEETNTLYVKAFEYDFYIQTVNSNIDDVSITAINNIVSNLTKVTDISIKPYAQRFVSVVKAFPKQKLSLVIGDRQLSLSVSTNNQRLSVGSVDSYLASIQITTAQLDTICKLFGDIDSIEVHKGVNCLCMMSKEKTLLLAGMIY